MSFFSGSRTGTSGFAPRNLIRHKTAAIVTVSIAVIAVPLATHAISDNSAHNPSINITSDSSQTSGSTEQPVNPKAKSTVNGSGSTTVQTSVEASGSNVTVEVNGEPVPVPTNGVITKQMPANDGQSNITVEVENSGSATNSSRGHLYMHSSTHSRATTSSSSSSQITNQGEIGP